MLLIITFFIFRRGSVSSVASVDEMHPKALAVIKTDKKVDKKIDSNEAATTNNENQKDVIEEMIKIIEMQRAVISEELMKAKKKAKKAKSEEIKVILDEMLKLAQLNDKLQFAEESVDRLEIALKQLKSSPNNTENKDQLITDHLACAKDEVSRLRSANDQAALEVKDNQKALDAMEQSKAERKQALKRLEYDVNVIEKEGRKLAKEYEKVLSINLDTILDEKDTLINSKLERLRDPLLNVPEQEDGKDTLINTNNERLRDTSLNVPKQNITDDEEEEEIYTLLNSSSTSTCSKQEENNSTTSSGHSSDPCVQELIAKESPIDVKNVNVNQQDENNSDTGLSSLHTSSDDGLYEVGTLV